MLIKLGNGLPTLVHNWLEENYFFAIRRRSQPAAAAAAAMAAYGKRISMPQAIGASKCEGF
jgi:hypothetical protein